MEEHRGWLEGFKGGVEASATEAPGLGSGPHRALGASTLCSSLAGLFFFFFLAVLGLCVLRTLRYGFL